MDFEKDLTGMEMKEKLKMSNLASLWLVFSLRCLLATACIKRTLTESSASVSWQTHPEKSSRQSGSGSSAPYHLQGHDRGRDLIRGGCLSLPPPQLVDFWDLTWDLGIDPSSAARTDLTLGLPGVGGIGAASFSFIVELRVANSADTSDSSFHV